ncbi:MAG TPA: NAD(P)-dependent oxidoreductase [Cyclobacteriaceae bacterium]|jgi:glyoxylate/hydroxypyruvate reductase A
MSVLIIAPQRDMKEWKKAIQNVDASLHIEIYPELNNPESVKAAVLWNHPPGILHNFPNLKWVTSLGAGVDHILKDKKIHSDIRITRIVDPGIAIQMSRMIVTMLTFFEKDLLLNWNPGKTGGWNTISPVPELKIGLMGIGEIGKKVASVLTELKYEVVAFGNTSRVYKNLRIFGQNELRQFLKSVDVAICLLPLTSKTENFINKDFFSLMNKGSYIMNLARGKIVDEDALLWALKTGILKKAYLDVFRQEPLPATHPFWSNPEIIITPHISGITDVMEGARQIVNNYHTFEDSEFLINEINRLKEY